METKINKSTITESRERDIYSIDCPICKQIIKGNSEGTVIYNFGNHFRQKHPGKKMGNYLFEESKLKENKK